MRACYPGVRNGPRGVALGPGSRLGWAVRDGAYGMGNGRGISWPHMRTKPLTALKHRPDFDRRLHRNR